MQAEDIKLRQWMDGLIWTLCDTDVSLMCDSAWMDELWVDVDGL